MVDAVVQHGYSGTTLRELVRLAGVSKSTFYEHFENKQEAFLATADTIFERVGQRIAATYAESTGDHRERLVAALSTYMDLVVDQPESAMLSTVDVLTLGRAGLAQRRRGTRIFEDVLGQAFDQSPTAVEVTPAAVRAAAAGIRGVVYRNLRDGTVTALPTLVEELADWALSYQRAENETVRRAVAAASEPVTQLPRNPAELDWTEPPDSPRSRAQLSQRDRIIRAVGQLVVEVGYEMLSIPAISARAGTSNQTFYENFDNKREAFLAAYDLCAAESLTATSEAFRSAGDSPEAVGIAARAMLEHIVGNPLFGRLIFFELPTAGPVALDRADDLMGQFAAFVRPGLAPKAVDATASEATLQAIYSGAWSVIRHELAEKDGSSPAKLAPEVVRIILLPLMPR
jgi:AcrR family transcriptional regulator